MLLAFRSVEKYAALVLLQIFQHLFPRGVFQRAEMKNIPFPASCGSAGCGTQDIGAAPVNKRGGPPIVKKGNAQNVQKDIRRIGGHKHAADSAVTVMHGHRAVSHGPGAERIVAHLGKRGPARKSLLKKRLTGQIDAPAQFPADVHKVHPAVAPGQPHTQKGVIVVDFLQGGKDFLFRHMTEADSHAVQGLKVQRDLALQQRPQLIHGVIEIKRVFPFVLRTDLTQQDQTADEKDAADQ